ncbi:serine hydrolase domain-containing protein [Actinoplanes sp. NPDC051411]|uniref:serine hydrolase domain-containing protein n=1 Tax=Actinoplanes sp. NPDC051411 TaxID=3155522 RepID=UPI00341C3992
MPAELHDAMAARIERGEFPGLVSLVARGDDVTVDVLGFTRFGGDVPMRRDTPFRITSMTKPVIAALAMMLAEDDLIDLEQPVATVLPELAGQRVLARPDAPLDETVPPARPVTVEDLLTFTNGFGIISVGQELNPDYPIVRAWREQELAMAEPEPRTPHDPDEWVRRFGTLPLIHQPGENWIYNGGTLILGVLLARVGGRPLGDLLRERLLEPLGMRDTGFWVPADRAGEIPVHYMTDFSTGQMAATDSGGAELWAAPPVFPSGSAGLVSTADDYLAFARLLLNRGVHGGTRLLSEQSVASMTTNHLSPEQIDAGGMLLANQGWGYGMAVTVTADEVSGPGRYGWAGGYGTSWFNDPREGLISIVLGQVSDLLWGGALTEFDRLAYGK